jgi:hypothetical protein
MQRGGVVAQALLLLLPQGFVVDSYNGKVYITPQVFFSSEKNKFLIL